MKSATLKNRFLYFITGDFNHLKRDGLYIKSIREKMPRSLRNAVLKRDNCVCQYCFKESVKEKLTVDHYIPYSIIKEHTLENLKTACLSCNTLKANINPMDEKDKQRWEKFLTKVSKEKILNSIQTIELELINNKIDHEEFIVKLASSLTHIGAQYRFNFKKRTNKFIKRNHPKLWENIYNKSTVNTEFILNYSN